VTIDVYELFYYPNNASLAPHFVLEEIGAPFLLRLVDRTRNAQKDPEYMRRNPLGRIPTLIDGDFVLFESAAICLHLADRHPAAQLAPRPGTPERGRLYQWLMFLTNTLQPDLMAFYYPERHTTDAGGTAAVKAAADERLGPAYAVIDDVLTRGGPYLLGEDVSIADFFLLMLVNWGRPLRRPPAQLAGIRRCVDLLATRPSVQRTAATEALDPLF
jgi:glutathione S-transferase